MFAVPMARSPLYGIAFFAAQPITTKMYSILCGGEVRRVEGVEQRSGVQSVQRGSTSAIPLYEYGNCRSAFMTPERQTPLAGRQATGFPPARELFYPAHATISPATVAIVPRSRVVSPTLPYVGAGCTWPPPHVQALPWGVEHAKRITSISKWEEAFGKERHEDTLQTTCADATVQVDILWDSACCTTVRTLRTDQCCTCRTCPTSKNISNLQKKKLTLQQLDPFIR